MYSKIAPRLAAVALAGALAAGCGGPPEPGEVEADAALVVVDNTDATISSATIYLLPENGIRQRLGTVTLGKEARFTVQPTAALQYRLVADAGVDELVSRPFTFTEGDRVTWDLDLNTVFYGAEASR